MKNSWLLSSMFLAGVLTFNAAYAIELRNGFGGPAGYGDLSQLPNDDESSSQLNLPFTLNFFGHHYSSFWANNNGNITFGGPVDTYTPQRFPVSSQPMIAPFWADVDTQGGGAVYTASPNSNTLVTTWNNVGYFDLHNDKVNDFQMTLLNRPDTGAGNFDIEFRYRQLQWTTGDFSGGVRGLGGIPAQAGYDAGDNAHFFALPGSFNSSILQLANTSNVGQDTPGLWTMAIRNGKISDGSSADAPLLPNIVQADGWHFNFNIQLHQTIFIDPLVATGYDFVVNSGPNIESALFPVLAADTDGYDIYGFDNSNNTYDISLGHVHGGDVFSFGAAGVSRFELRDIDIGAGLDPSNTQAFVTGLTFVTAGDVSMTQTPLTVMAPIPEPETYALLLAGLGLISAVARRART
ncbi:nidogen-like domain-containing protein [Nitrosovibrio tenuis]|uniref:PEP-CTERM protein-sorting domain-containing protein n=1 Tax=Nitrosovibrio tenuis TaxID=1233 RepID=A0A1H7K2M8_9PROT|nr:nidogen-like domain-containing protein [Nitrosovibrio tenuis]SEK80135.1 PEP-CTERM protein-sorting domain-containing protein [Nitrosovibrio tenuis]